MFKASIVIWELAIEVLNRVPQVGWDCLSAVHFLPQ
jgi:hypothetical protein